MRGNAGRISLRLAKFSSSAEGLAGVGSMISFIVALLLHTRSHNPTRKRPFESITKA
jgi:hypothetical protein